VVIRKAAQVYVSEFLVNAACWCSHTKQGGRGNSLFVFPKDRQAQDFSVARIDKAIKGSPDILAKTEAPMNVGLKRVGDGFIYIRGAQTRDSLISVDADMVLCDEIAQYPAGTIDVIEKRLGSSLLGWIRRARPRATRPTRPASTGTNPHKRCEIRCSHCARWQHLDLLTHLDPDTARVVYSLHGRHHRGSAV
jgi:phage terminase large subunit GpA-like protein